MLARSFGPRRVLLQIAFSARRVAYRSELPGRDGCQNVLRQPKSAWPGLFSSSRSARRGARCRQGELDLVPTVIHAGNRSAGCSRRAAVLGQDIPGCIPPRRASRSRGGMTVINMPQAWPSLHAWAGTSLECHYTIAGLDK